MAYPRCWNLWTGGVQWAHIAASAHGKNRAEKRMTHPVCQGERAQSSCALTGFRRDGPAKSIYGRVLFY
tara:strand:- start:560 stop:766 length:207 start_codon:yes stop_codon:yes gene_type:complete